MGCGVSVPARQDNAWVSNADQVSSFAGSGDYEPLFFDMAGLEPLTWDSIEKRLVWTEGAMVFQTPLRHSVDVKEFAAGVAALMSRYRDVFSGAADVEKEGWMIDNKQAFWNLKAGPLLGNEPRSKTKPLPPRSSNILLVVLPEHNDSGIFGLVVRQSLEDVVDQYRSTTDYANIMAFATGNVTPSMPGKS